MKVLVLLLLGLQGCAEGERDCTSGQDNRLRILKNDSAYQLQLCTSTDDCTTQFYFNFILCKNEQEICKYCRGILGRPAQGKVINVNT